jgi:hypothetical protein
MRGSFFILSLLVITGCAGLSERGEKVKIIRVTPRKDLVKQEVSKLYEVGCEFKGNITAGISPGSTAFEDRLMIELKNQVGERGGNVVLSSLRTYGIPPKSKGKYFSCPEQYLEEFAEVDI